uniref:Uncharacterized protein n=1 Tax=Steinernema glaseri TaxID=37863 RepID=A0A1I7Y551_9BILA
MDAAHDTQSASVADPPDEADGERRIGAHPAVSFAPDRGAARGHSVGGAARRRRARIVVPAMTKGDGPAMAGKAYRSPGTMKLIYYTYMWKRRDRKLRWSQNENDGFGSRSGRRCFYHGLKGYVFKTVTFAILSPVKTTSLAVSQHENFNCAETTNPGLEVERRALRKSVSSAS